MHFFYSRQIAQGTITLDEGESHHCNRVLRLQKGEIIGVLDGKGNLFECKISEPGKKNNILEIINVYYSYPLPYYIHIALAPTKSFDRLEWFAEKATELGVQEISFLKCTNSERIKINIERLNKKLVSALKQSQNRYLPQVNQIQNFETFINSDIPGSQKFIASISDPPNTDLALKIKATEKYILLIGPEGDFTNEEVTRAIQNNYTPVGLGNSRLRTETAALAGIFAFLVVNQIDRK